jgi:hypothetical protein
MLEVMAADVSTDIWLTAAWETEEEEEKGLVFQLVYFLPRAD